MHDHHLAAFDLYPKRREPFDPALFSRPTAECLHELLSRCETSKGGDWTNQGLPFYAGNVTYRCPLSQAGPVAIRIPHHATPLLKVNDTPVMAPPYRATLTAPENDVAVTAFGNRHNAFGNFHLSNSSLKYHGPSSYRSTVDALS